MRSILCSILLIGIISCGQQERADSQQVFRYNIAAGLTSLDPAFARNQANTWVTQHLYQGLVQLDSQLMVQPAIAQRWEIDSSGTMYTFHLRSGVRFHDDDCFPNGIGREVTAHDVAYSFLRILDPEVASPGSWIFRGKVDTIQPFEALDDTTFRLRLLRPFRPMLGILTMPYCAVVPQEAVASYGTAFRRHPVGTGPFRLVSWVEDEGLILERNPHYWEDGLPRIQRVEIQHIDNKMMEFLSFLDGSLDFVSDIDAGMKDRVLTLEGNLAPGFIDKMQLLRSPYLNTEYLGFRINDTAAGPEQLQAIRQAVNYGFNRKDMLRFLRNNKGIPATQGMIPAGMPGYAADADYGYSYDPAKASSLLADAGYPNGEGLSPITLYAPPSYMDLCEFMQSQLAQIGIRLQLEVTQPALLRSRMEKGEAPFFRGSWIADYPDPESYMALFFSGYGSPPNYTAFADAVVDSLYVSLVAATSDREAYHIARVMDSLVMISAPVVPLYYDEVYRFTRPGVKNLGVNAMNLLDLRYVTKE